MNEVFEAVFDRLKSQLSVEIFDYVPQDFRAFPFIRIDALTLTENDTDFETGFDGSLQIIVYSNYRGSKEVADINYEIYQALHRYDLPDTANFGISTIHQEFSNILIENDGITRKSVQRFRILFEPLPEC